MGGDRHARIAVQYITNGSRYRKGLKLSVKRRTKGRRWR
jgi:hypothetical protein